MASPPILFGDSIIVGLSMPAAYPVLKCKGSDQRLNTVKPTERIASLLNISEVEAREFCIEIQRLTSGLPAFRLIESYLVRHPTANAEEVASALSTQLRSKGANRKKKACAKRFYPGTLPGERVRFRNERGDNRTAGPSSRMTGKGVSVAPQGMKKCPHGVPVYRKCAICDPLGFRDEWEE
jgi:hypothetical protein